MGSLVSAARQEGYTNTGKPRVAAEKEKEKAAPRQRNPYHGYYFKILKKQGPHAPGGKYDYIINGNMIAGYALIAYPDKWGSSGVMTFIVNQQGRVYQKNLGADTAKIAAEIKEYDPDSTWKQQTRLAAGRVVYGFGISSLGGCENRSRSRSSMRRMAPSRW
jgi:hypothetical protein